MDASVTEKLLESRALVWVLAALAGLLWLTTNLPWQLDDYDQAKQAFTSFEMVKEGHWFYQRTPHERVATKPPLVGWISAGIFEITRSWQLAWRGPSLGAAVALAFLLFRGGRCYGPASGVMALAAFAFNLLTPRLATLVRTDMPLALLIFAIVVIIWQHLRQQTEWQEGDRMRLFFLISAAMLIKGPIVYAFLLPGILAFAWWRRSNTTVSAWCGWWPWVASFCLFAGWVVVGSKLVPGFYEQVVVREFLGRFGETIHRPQPPYFYLLHLLHKFAPWSLFMLGLAIVPIVRRSKFDQLELSGSKSKNPGQRLPTEIVWLVCVVLGGLIVMSIIPSKRVDRMFPILPPLCLLLAAQLKIKTSPVHASPNHGVGTPAAQTPYRLATASLLVALFYAGGYGTLKVVSGYRDHRDALVRFGQDVRARAVRDHLRYDVVEAADEGLLLYLQKLHFVKPHTAREQWEHGDIDALVISADQKWPDEDRQPNKNFTVQLQSLPAPGRDQYFFVTR